MRVTGRGAWEKFRDEGGGHRWQRVPPTEKRGRVHTSTVTVAVLPEATDVELELDMNDVEVKTTRGSGPGGQHRNKTDTAVQVTHVPTGIQVRAEDGRSQHINRQNALGLLRMRLLRAKQEQVRSERDGSRRQQVGSGMRGDKVRTVQEQNDRVTNHVNGKQMRLKAYLRGHLGEIL